MHTCSLTLRAMFVHDPPRQSFNYLESIPRLISVISEEYDSDEAPQMLNMKLRHLPYVVMNNLYRM